MMGWPRRPFIGNGEGAKRLREEIQKAAQTDAAVLIRGETGTGKELVARAIHEGSCRAGASLIAVNCADLPESLIESELFGHEKGAFTGADRFRKGKFELAPGGTLFLDEIGELSIVAQAKLLRVLQEREVDRVGGERPIPVDFRLIAATNRDLLRMIEERTFRQDLYYRLNGFTIFTPSLRDRLEDIPALANHFAHHFGQQAARRVRGVSREVLALFLKHSWPGNVRELERTIQSAVSTGNDEWIEKEHLPPDFFGKAPTVTVTLQGFRKTINDVSRHLCLYALGVSKGNCSKAAKVLGLDRSTFCRIARRHGLADLLDA